MKLTAAELLALKKQAEADEKALARKDGAIGEKLTRLRDDYGFKSVEAAVAQLTKWKAQVGKLEAREAALLVEFEKEFGKLLEV